MRCAQRSTIDISLGLLQVVGIGDGAQVVGVHGFLRTNSVGIGGMIITHALVVLLRALKYGGHFILVVGIRDRLAVRRWPACSASWPKRPIFAFPHPRRVSA